MLAASWERHLAGHEPLRRCTSPPADSQLEGNLNQVPNLLCPCTLAHRDEVEDIEVGASTVCVFCGRPGAIMLLP